MRQLNLLDKTILIFDTLFFQKQSSVDAIRKNPAENIPEASLNAHEKKHIAGLMRVNHAGEVCAQALYQGQAITAKLDSVRDKMLIASDEEIDHLMWCEQRLTELNASVSILNPIWFTLSFFIGAIAGIAGDKWSLGFVAETENQVGAHLKKHLTQLPATDKKSAAIIKQMHEDETKHASMAIDAGGTELPLLIKELMKGMSKIMTSSSYYI